MGRCSIPVEDFHLRHKGNLFRSIRVSRRPDWRLDVEFIAATVGSEAIVNLLQP